MAVITDALSDALNDNVLLLKLVMYAVPVFLCASAYLGKNMFLFYLCLLPTLILLISLLSVGISNIMSNKHEILTLNIFSLFFIAVKLFFALAPHVVILSLTGFALTTFVKIPSDLPYLPIIYKCFVWAFLFSFCLTAYLAFSKNLEVKNAYNLQVLSESSVDIFIVMLFLIPQICLIDAFFVGLVWYFFFFFHVSATNPLFIFYCSAVVVLNISILASYFAQVTYESIKGDDSDYRDNYYIKINNKYSEVDKKPEGEDSLEVEEEPKQ